MFQKFENSTNVALFIAKKVLEKTGKTDYTINETDMVSKLAILSEVFRMCENFRHDESISHDRDWLPELIYDFADLTVYSQEIILSHEKTKNRIKAKTNSTISESSANAKIVRYLLSNYEMSAIHKIFNVVALSMLQTRMRYYKDYGKSPPNKENIKSYAIETYCSTHRSLDYKSLASISAKL